MFPVRLACVKHAASVHPEPGSNSLIKCVCNLALLAAAQLLITEWAELTRCLMHSRQPTSLVISRHYCLISFHSLECGSSILTNRTAIHAKFDFVSLSVHCVKNFRESYVFHCLVIKVVLLSALCDSLFRLSHLEDLVKNFFKVFRSVFQRISSPSFFLSVQATWLLYHKFSRLSTVNLNFLKTDFFFSIPEAIPCDSLFNIPLPQGEVKHFLQIIADFFVYYYLASETAL